LGKWFKYLGFATVALTLGSAAAGAADLVTTHPGHYARPGETLQGSGSSILDRTKQVRAGSNVIVRDDGALAERWILNADLSRACNKRLFRQKRDQYLIGVVEGRSYGAAVGGHGSLVDRVRMAENQVVYLFRGQGTTDCRVYHRSK
jgi:hypothetical protein